MLDDYEYKSHARTERRRFSRAMRETSADQSSSLASLDGLPRFDAFVQSCAAYAEWISRKDAGCGLVACLIALEWAKQAVLIVEQTDR